MEQAIKPYKKNHTLKVTAFIFILFTGYVTDAKLIK